MDKGTYYKNELDKLIETIDYNISVAKKHYNYEYNEGKLDTLEAIRETILNIIMNSPKDANYED